MFSILVVGSVGFCINSTVPLTFGFSVFIDLSSAYALAILAAFADPTESAPNTYPIYKIKIVDEGKSSECVSENESRKR